MPARRPALVSLLVLACAGTLSLGAAGPASAAFAPHGLWEATLGEPQSYDTWADVASAPDGSAYAAGTFDLGMSPLTGDIVVAKYGGSTAGSLTWTRRWDDPVEHGADWTSALAVDKKGAVVVAGHSSTAAGSFRWLVLKWSASGAQKWVATFAAPASIMDAYVRDVAVDASGDVYVCGSEAYTGEGVALVVRKLSGATGALLWEARYTGPAAGYNTAGAIALDAAGNAYVSGSGEDSSEVSDMLLAKFAHADGRRLWLRRIDGPEHSDDEGMELAITSAGVWATGRAWAADDNSCRIIVSRYSPAGKRRWLRTWIEQPGTINDADALAVDAAGNVVVAGSNNPQTVTFEHALLLKYNGKGKLLWSRVTYDQAQPFAVWSAVVCRPNGDIWVGGDATVVADRWDLVVARYSPAGQVVWTSNWESAADTDASCNAIALGKTGLFVAGSISSQDDSDAVLAMYLK